MATYTCTLAVNFGTVYGGLTTVAYRLLNTDGTELATWSTTGVVESPASSGMYYVETTLNDDWAGIVQWRQASTDPVYAMEGIDYQVMATYSRVTTAIPNAAPGAAGGLPTVDASNRVAGVSGNVAGSVGSVTAPVALTSAYDAAKTAATQASVNAVKAKTDLITSGGITIHSMVAGQRYIELAKGYDHPASEGLALVFEDTESDWGDYSTAASALEILDRSTGELVVSISGIYAPGPPKTISFEPTVSETRGLTTGHRIYGFQLVITPSGGEPFLRAWGDVTVLSFWP